MTTLRLGALDVERAAAIVRAGGLVAFPTETVYGLGADGTAPTAVRRLYAVKGRPGDNPLILHVNDAAMARGLAAQWPLLAQRLAERFWPGPLTLVVPCAVGIPDEVTAGLDTVALRAPAHPLAQALIRAAGVPVAAPSANRSGRPSPTTAAHVLADLDGRIDAVLDGGPTPIGVESSVVDVTATPARLLRPGGLPRELIEACIGPLAAADATGPARAPGMRHRHYAPQVPLLLVPAARVAAELKARPRTGALVSDETAATLSGFEGPVERLGPRGEPAVQAARLFAALHALDAVGVDCIVAEEVPDVGLGHAVLDRLRRAASAGRELATD